VNEQFQQVRGMLDVKAATSYDEDSRIEVRLPYHGHLLAAHMHDPSATRPGEVDTMIGIWLGALLSTRSHWIGLSGVPDSEAGIVPRVKGHGW
jgi:hypothetical protein